MTRSPSGKTVVPNEGRLDSRILLLGESPAREEVKQGRPFVGRAGRVLDQALVQADISRLDCMVANCVPVRAPGDEFSKHSADDLHWGREQLQDLLDQMPQLEVIVALGNNPLTWTTGLRGVRKWRGSMWFSDEVMEGYHDKDPNAYWRWWGNGQGPSHVTLPRRVNVMPTFHPAAVARQFVWHVWLVNDLQKAKRWLQEPDKCVPRRRQWFIQKPQELDRLVDEVILPHERMVSVDTEMDPKIVCLVTEEEVHTFEWSEVARPAMERLFSSPHVLKVAHNMNHDWRWLEKVLDIPVVRPWYDTMAGAHYLEPSGSDGERDRRKSAGEQQVGKALSPHISSKFTWWPYHKWLVDVDPRVYCGIDTVVAYDAYWSQIEQIYQNPELVEIGNMDMRLFEVMMDMTRRGVGVDEAERQRVGHQLSVMLEELDETLMQLAQPGIERGLERRKFKKPHLFQQEKRCPCCMGGKVSRSACWRCAGFDEKPSKKQLVDKAERLGYPQGARDMLKSKLEQEMLGVCHQCRGKGHILHRPPFNPDSTDALADLLYRGWGLPARRQKGSETVAYELLGRMLEEGGFLDHPKLVEQHEEAKAFLHCYLQRNRIATDLATISRMAPGVDGRLRCVFDLWYTPTQRVASREGLLDEGTNLQNIPKEARRFIVPQEGYAYAYPDYAQVEGRCVAVASKDEALMEIYNSGLDSHMEVVKLVGKEGVEITRDQAKRLTYASMYGIEPGHLATIMGVSPLKAQEILQAFFRAFPGVKRYHRDIEQQILQTRGVRTPTGWVRRWLSYVMVTKGRKKGRVREKVWKEGLATPPQNMGAHIMGLGLLNVWDEAPWMLPALQIHDAALLEIPLDRLGEGIREMERLMTIRKWGMVFPVDASLGPNWYVASMSDQEKIEKGYSQWTRQALLDPAV